MSSGFHYLGANVAGKAPVLSAPKVTEAAPMIGFHAALRERAAPAPTAHQVARASGYTGDQCTTCNSMHMRINGHCLVCEDCGTSTGCS